MVMEILASLLKTGLEDSCFKAHPKYKQLKITLLSIADDVLLFFQGEKESLLAIKDILRVFSSKIGLMLNYAKTTLIIGSLQDEVHGKFTRELQGH